MGSQNQPVVSRWAAGQVPLISQLNPVVPEFVGGSLIGNRCDLAGCGDWVRVEDDLLRAGVRLIPAENDGFTAVTFVELRGWVTH